MKALFLLFFYLFIIFPVRSQFSFQEKFDSFYRIQVNNDVVLTIDEPNNLDLGKPMRLILFALPNGNSTAFTFGKKINEGDDWHYNIQHIGAQTEFIRRADPSQNYVVVYAENGLKSWPAWRSKYADNSVQIREIVERIKARYKSYHPKMTLNCHSGGGSFLFGFMNAYDRIPDDIDRICFLDATYGYETGKHSDKLKAWLLEPEHHLEVISYNDSVVVYNGKPLVSPTGGTWYRSRLLAKDLQLETKEFDDRIVYTRVSPDNIEMILIKNPRAEIYHTVLVEKNGFIHSIFKATRFENKDYAFWDERAYTSFILK